MKALLWDAPDSMNLVEMERPTPEPNEVLIQVGSVGICGSDLEGYLGHNSLRKPPLLMGHEFAGIVADAGSGVTDWHVGDRVVINPLLSCGRCPRCIRGNANLCDERKIIGIHKPGAYAEFVTVPTGSLLRLPDSLSFASAALTEPLACSLRAARRALQGKEFAGVAVLGAGAIGLLNAFVARMLGASQVIVLDKNRERVALASELGFLSETFEPGIEEKVGRIAGKQGIDVVIDAAGFQQTRELAIRLLGAGGRLMNIGLGIDDTMLPLNYAVRSEFEIMGSFCYTRQDFSDALSLLGQGRITGDGWSALRPLSEGSRSFRELTRGAVREGKIILQPNG